MAPWYRCYAEQPAEPVGLPTPPACGPWRVYTGGRDALRKEVVELFKHEPSADRTIAVLGRPHDAGAVETALLAAQDAIRTGHLLALSPHSGWAGLWAALHAEHPATGITTVRAELDQAGLRAAGQIGAAPGEYRELTIDADGAVRELVMAPVGCERSGSFPLGEGDVVLISRAAGAAGLALAQVLACCGAAVAFVGRDHPGRDDAVIAALEQLRQAGAPITYEIVNPASAAALDAAVRRIERRLGPVTAVAHAVRPTPPRAIACLRPADLRAHVASEARLLDHLVTAACGRDHALRFIVTFGSVAGRYGLGEAAAAALAAGMVTDQGERLADASAGCRPLHIDWPVAMPVADGSRLLLGVLGAAAELPGRLAVHGRVGPRAPRSIALAAAADPAATGRFTERVLVHYPGVELIVEATLDTTTDPYLTDYVVDGASLLPPTIAIEAMAQAASALAGTPTRSATEVSMAAPVVLAGPHAPTVLRICALKTGDAVTAVVRCDVTAFAVDHFSAIFAPSGPGVSDITSKQSARVGCRDLDRGALGAAEIYESLCFQTGRFRRLNTVRPEGAHSASALADGHDTQAWFRLEDGVDRRQDLVLGSAAISDAALQLVQCCVPHRKLSFAGCDRAEFGLVPSEQVTITATEVTTAGGVSCWNVDVIDSSGREVLLLRGLTMRDAGALAPVRPWPAPLLGCLLEQVAGECGLGPDLEVSVGKAHGNGQQARSRLAASADTRVAGLALRVRADGPVGCAWRTDRPALKGPAANRLAPWLAVVDPQRLTAGDAVCALALASVIASCMNAATPPPDLAAEVLRVAASNWLLLQADNVRVLAALVDIKNAKRPVAIALRTGAPAMVIRSHPECTLGSLLADA